MNREKMNRDMNRESTRKAIGAVDIGGTKIAVGVVDETGRALAKERSAGARCRAASMRP